MGRWGDGIFQGDADLDVADDISANAGFELWLYWVTDDPEIKALGLEGTREKLNEGVFDALFEKYKAKGDESGFFGANHCMVILVLLGMQVGATISKAQIAYTRSIYRHGAGLLEGGLEQVSRALKDYDNKPYDFKIKGLLETANDLDAARTAQPGNESSGSGFVMLNYPYNQFG